MKACNTCKIEKPFTDFFKRADRHYNDAYRSDCRICWAAKAAARRLRTPPELLAARERAWRENNADAERARGKRWRELNKENGCLRTKRYRERHPERCRAAQDRWSKENRDKERMICARRRAKKLQATPPWLTDDHKKSIAAIYRRAVQLTKETGTEYHVDHIVPLAGRNVRGLHVPWNLQVITASENHRKWNKT